jgi:ABC-type multidrug transport system ATPase subunit
VATPLMRKMSAFVFQDDVILSTMTVREAILLSARLRLPGAMPLAEKRARVEKVIYLMHLERCADTVIGSATDKGGISGGERKRTSIGMELITNPPVLFLDEPTTGLDTYTAFSIMDTLRQLAASGRTVVATIHQPSSDMFHLFDDLLILAHGQVRTI